MHVTTVSVVIPVKDDAPSLARCLAALKEQSHAPLEIVVVDDGSVDDSAAVARASGARVVASSGTGIPAASATGYDAAGGDILARLDADCIADRDWIERLVIAFDDDEVAAVTGFARFHDGPRALRRVLARLYLLAYFAAVAPALGHLPLFGSNLALRRSAWLEVRDSVHRDDELVHDDLDLAMHLGPVRRIRLDTSLGMAMSFRPFRDPRAFALRVRRGMHSILVHWPHDVPWRRWYRRLRVRRIRPATGSTIPS